MTEQDKKDDKRIDYLKYINTAGIAVVVFLAGYMSQDVRDIKTAQQVQAVELMRLDTNQKTVFKSLEIMNTSIQKLGESDTNMKIEWIQAIQDLKDKIKR